MLPPLPLPADNLFDYLATLPKQVRDQADPVYRRLLTEGHPASGSTYRLAVANVQQAAAHQARRSFEGAGGQCWNCRDGERLTNRQPCQSCGRQRITLQDAVAGVAARQEAGNRAVAAAHATLPWSEWGDYTLASWVAAGGNRQGDLYGVVSDFVQHWEPKEGTALLLLGERSTGKTGLAIAAMMELAARYALPCAFIPAASLISDYLQNWQEAKLYQRFQRAHIVVLDDLGMQRRFGTFDVAGFFSELLAQPAVEFRGQQVPKSLIVTSNRLISPDADQPSLMEQFGDLGDRIVERLIERSKLGRYLVELPASTAEVNLRLRTQG